METNHAGAAAALALLLELGRFDLKDRRPGQNGRDWRGLAAAVITHQLGFGLPCLRVKANWEDVAALVPMQANHAGEGLRWLQLQGIIEPIREDAGARIVSVVADARLWRCSQIFSREDCLARMNAVRVGNGLVQLAFLPGDLSANERSLRELTAEVSRENLLAQAGGAFVDGARCTRDVLSPNGRGVDGVPSMGVSPKLGFVPNLGSVSHPSNKGPKGPIRSNVNSIKGPIRGPSSQRAAEDGYIVEKLSGHPHGRKLLLELQAGTTLTAQRFQRLYDRDQDDARAEIAEVAQRNNPGSALNVRLGARFESQTAGEC